MATAVKIAEAPPTAVVNDPRYCAFQPFGDNKHAMYDRSPEVLLEGPAGTGKSRTWLEKIHLCAQKYPGMRALMVRKTRESLTQSTMVTYEKFVLTESSGVHFRTSEQEYRYPNGSKLVVGGMDKASKVLSSEYDIIYVPEATEITEEDWETLITRCRYGVMPYNQMLADCNPGPPRHWVKIRWEEGTMKQYHSDHEDNPRLWDHEKNEWTKAGLEYISKLSSLTGLRRKRLFLGLWVSAEGMIYEEEWNPDVHLIPRFKAPLDWQRIWVVDFGFTNPFVWQNWVYDPNRDILYRTAEIYQTKLLVEDASALIKRWKRLNSEPDPAVIIADWDAEDRATLERHLGLEVETAIKDVTSGIENVKSYLKVREDGNSSLYFMRDSLLEIDYDLKDFGKPYKTEDEFEGYEWDNKIKKEQPKKVDDHGMDCTRYLCNHIIDFYGGGEWSRGISK